MENLLQHISSQPFLVAIFIIALFVAAASVPYFLKQKKRYGSYFSFASKSRKILTGGAIAVVSGLLLYGITPYTPPPTDELAIVLGNTKNTPQPKLQNDISDVITETMLLHKGDDAYEIADSIKIISAVKSPEVINLSVSELELQEIGNNNSNAQRSARLNIQAIEKKINTLAPTDNGADYMEAIFEARNNVEEGSTIIVIGSGLSDTGDLNFSSTNMLTNEDTRLETLKKLQDKYGQDYLESYKVVFYGLGDTTKPQEELSTKQKEIVRELYMSAIRALGGDVDINTETLNGDSVNTDYVVGTTDTGCGELGLIFDDNNLKFVSNAATFENEAAAKESLISIKDLWDKDKDVIESIQVDGYIAHYPGPDTLSQKRADAVKKLLIDFGIPSEKIGAKGLGFGPYDQDQQNRMVKVNISRDSDICEN